MLRFPAKYLLGGHCLEVDHCRRHWSCDDGTSWPGGGRQAGQKISNNILQTGKVKHLHIELRNKGYVVLLGVGGIGGIT